MNSQHTFLRWTALAMVAILFLWTGAFEKLSAWNQTVGYIASKGFPWPSLLTLGAVCVEIAAPLALFVPRWRSSAFLILALFTLATALMFHDFWRADGPEHAQLQNFFKNFALAGALLYMFIAERARATDTQRPIASRAAVQGTWASRN